MSVLTLAQLICWTASATDSENRLAKRFQSLNRNAQWSHVRDIPLQFDAHHPQGMTIVGEHFYVSSVEVIDRAAGEGVGHIFKVARDGSLAASATVGDGAAYHPSGMDFDGERLWVAAAEYRPDSRTIVYTVDPQTLAAKRVFAFDDHIGGIVHDRAGRQLVGVSWGARRIYRWPLEARDGEWQPIDAASPEVAANPSHYIDYQDMQVVPGRSMILCSGLAGIRDPRGGASIRLGGIDLIDATSLRHVHQLPIPLWTETGKPYTQNPVYTQTNDAGGLRFYFLPEDGRATMYVWDASPR